MKLVMLSGLPASGKSTKAREMVADGNWYRVNRDLLRTMLHFDNFTGKNEGVTVDVEKMVVGTLLSAGKNVIVDDTNLNPKNKEMWKSVATMYDAEFEHLNIDTPAFVCCIRDLRREKIVGKDVIENMALQYGLFVPSKDSVVICDIDGTVADCTHRQHYVKGDKKDWRSFFAEMSGDTVRPMVRSLLIELLNQGKYIVFVSGRPETYKAQTLKWLEENGLWFAHTIIMRGSNDTRPDTTVKKDILDKYFKDKSVIHKVIDDRPSVIRMWRENGLEVLDVGNGEEF